MKFFKNVIVLKIFRTFSLEFFDISSSTESLGHFAQKENNLNIVGSLMAPDSSWDGWSHLYWESIEVRGTVEVDISNFILDFGLNFVELDSCEEGGGDSVELSHKW